MSVLDPCFVMERRRLLDNCLALRGVVRQYGEYWHDARKSRQRDLAKFRCRWAGAREMAK